MPDPKQLGAYWGEEALYFVETTDSKPTKHFSIPFDKKTKKAIHDGPFSDGSRKLIQEIQGALKQQRITTSALNLALSPGDIIFRSFTIPFMTQNEISSVVEFEASKYIPFSLNELSFYFHPVLFKSHNMKYIRVIFVAIKKSTLKNYIKILEEATLEVFSVEPSSSTLLRVLNAYSLIPPDQTFALVSVEKTGKIVIIDNLIPHFVREFYSSTISSSDPEVGENFDDFLKKWTREIKISLDYFNRQSEHLQIKQIYLISSPGFQSFSENLEKNLTLPIINLQEEESEIFQLGKTSNQISDYLCAFGACLVSPSDPIIHFNLHKHKTEKSHVSIPLPTKPTDFKLVLKASIICVPLIVVALVGRNLGANSLKEQVKSLQAKLGPFSNVEQTMIETQHTLLTSKLTYFQNTYLKTSTSELLLYIPDLLPDGIWLDNLEIIYDDSATFNVPSTDLSKSAPGATSVNNAQAQKPFLSVILSGFAFSEQKNNQFRLINTTLQNLKDKDYFSSLFDKIDLEATQAKELGEHSVTSFKIACKKAHETDRLK